MIAQEETSSILLLLAPWQVCAACVTKCHQASVAEETGIALNERHV